MNPEQLAEIENRPVPHGPNALWTLKADRDALLAEVKRLQSKLDQPCGSCHPCSNYADETWRAAGRKPPHVFQWDELRAEKNAALDHVRRLCAQRDHVARTVREFNVRGHDQCVGHLIAELRETFAIVDGQRGTEGSEGQ